MAETLRVARLFFVLLALVTTGRWLMGTFGVPYEEGHHIFSIVILTVFSCLYYGAFTRRWLDYRLINALMLGVVMGLAGLVSAAIWLRPITAISAMAKRMPGSARMTSTRRISTASRQPP